MDKSLTFSELDIALKKLKTKKSLGLDHITNEMLIHLECFASTLYLAQEIEDAFEEKMLPS